MKGCNLKKLKGQNMNKKLRYTLDLQLFAGEGAEGVNGETGAENAVAGQNGAVEVTADDEISELINGKFKEQFTKKTQAIIDKRFHLRYSALWKNTALLPVRRTSFLLFLKLSNRIRFIMNRVKLISTTEK